MLRKLLAYDAPTEEWGDESTGRRIHYQDLTTIDWSHDLAKDRVRRKKLAVTCARGWRGWLWRVWDASQAWLVVAAIGISCGLAAATIDVVSEWLSDLKTGYCRESWYLNHKFCCWQDSTGCAKHWSAWADSSTNAGYYVNYAVYVSFALLFAGCSAILVRRYAPFAAGSGIPEVKTILSGFIIRKFLGAWTLVTKAVGLTLSVAAGLTLGKEGPSVHIACCLGNIIPRLFEKYRTNEAKKREVLSAACSAGVSVAFGAPVGGVLFALEEVSTFFPYKTLWRSFFCAMVAAVTLQMANPFRTNQLVQYQVRYDRQWHAFELGWFVFLGVFGGIFGTFFIRLNLRIQRWRKTSIAGRHPVTEVLLITFLTAALGYINVFTRANLGELVSHLFRECEETDFHDLCNPVHRTQVITSLMLVAISKMALMVITFGISVPAGIFIPSMVVGASFGRVVGILVQWVHLANPAWAIFSSCPAVGVCVTPGTYAMVGAAAALAGVTRMTVSLVVIMFELTGALSYVLPIMIAVMVAKWVGDALEPEGIYDALIQLRKYPFLDARESYKGKSIMRDIMTPFERLKTINGSGMTIGELEQLVADLKVTGFPVITDDSRRHVLGFICRSELLFVLKQARGNGAITSETRCTFLPLDGVAEQRVFGYGLDDWSPNSTSDVSLVATSSSEAINAQLNLRGWMDRTPMLVAPLLPVEIGLEVFRKMGVRYVLVNENARLEGIVTKKDLLEHMHSLKEE